jgi:hypothetical protein
MSIKLKIAKIIYESDDISLEQKLKLIKEIRECDEIKEEEEKVEECDEIKEEEEVEEAWPGIDPPTAAEKLARQKWLKDIAKGFEKAGVKVAKKVV